MKSPCAILALLPLLLFATTIESRNEPGATATNYQPTHNHIYLKPNPSGPSHGPIMLRPIPSRLYGVIRSDPSNGFTHSGQSDNKEPQERVKYLGQQCRSSPIAYSYKEDFKTPKSSVKDLDAKPSFSMIFGDGFKQISSPTKEYSRLTPDVDNVAIAHFLENLRRAQLSLSKATPDVATINMDVETPKKSLYNNFRPAYAAPYYGDLQRPALLSPVKATPDVAITNIAVKALMKSLFRATPYASPYSGDVVPKGKNPHAQPSTPWNIINWS